MKEFSKLISNEKPLSRFYWSNKIEDQKALLEAVGYIDIKELIRNSKFPDFLGHIGLLLSSCQRAENGFKIISENLLKQMHELTSDENFKSLIAVKKVLKPDDLNSFEILLENILNKVCKECDLPGVDCVYQFPSKEVEKSIEHNCKKNI